jgi:hypothetical protein
MPHPELPASPPGTQQPQPPVDEKPVEEALDVEVILPKTRPTKGTRQTEADGIFEFDE